MPLRSRMMRHVRRPRRTRKAKCWAGVAGKLGLAASAFDVESDGCRATVGTPSHMTAGRLHARKPARESASRRGWWSDGYRFETGESWTRLTAKARAERDRLNAAE